MKALGSPNAADGGRRLEDGEGGGGMLAEVLLRGGETIDACEAMSVSCG
jgi:hypothetical protein